jgi:hypothetical protein
MNHGINLSDMAELNRFTNITLSTMYLDRKYEIYNVMGSFAAKFTRALDDINEALGISVTHAASNVLLLRITRVPMNASRFLVANRIDPLRRATVNYTIFFSQPLASLILDTIYC